MKWGDIQMLYWLAALVPVFLLARWGLARRRRRLDALISPALQPALLPDWNPAAARGRLWLRLAAAALLIIAMARPQWGFHWEEVRRQGLDILVVFDTSRSMTATDIKPTRMQQAKWGVRDLLRQLRGDRIGLIPFAGSSLLQCPLTVDYAAFALTLDDIYAGIIPRGGTAIEQALRLAMGSFPEGDEADRVILLITDGEDHVGNPLALLPDLQAKGIRVYAIGIGTLEGEMVPGDNTRDPYFKDRQGQVVKTSLHEDALQKLALGTGGTYVRSAAGDTGLERVFQESIAQLKRSEQESRTAKVYEERFMWPLLAAFLLLALEAGRSNRRRQTDEQEARV